VTVADAVQDEVEPLELPVVVETVPEVEIAVDEDEVDEAVVAVAEEAVVVAGWLQLRSIGFAPVNAVAGAPAITKPHE